MDAPQQLPPFDIFFAGLENLSPGGNEHTLAALGMLARRDHAVIVDVGCGTGRTTLALARALGRTIHAVDIMEAFLAELRTRAAQEGLAALIETHTMDMAELPARFAHIDLLWCEGAAFCMGYAQALQSWARVIPEGGHAVVSELVWLHDGAPAEVKEFFASGYPEMRTRAGAREVAEASGYRVLGEIILPPECWTGGYFDGVARRCHELRAHPDAAVRGLVDAMRQEIDIYEKSEGSYSYVIYVLERT